MKLSTIITQNNEIIQLKHQSFTLNTNLLKNLVKNNHVMELKDNETGKSTSYTQKIFSTLNKPFKAVKGIFDYLNFYQGSDLTETVEETNTDNLNTYSQTEKDSEKKEDPNFSEQSQENSEFMDYTEYSWIECGGDPCYTQWLEYKKNFTHVTI